MGDNSKRLFKILSTLILLLAVLEISTKSVYAQIVINEFLPAPSSGNLEWIEFYNTASSSADLSDYYFDDDTDFNSDSGSSSKVALSGLLSGQATCYWELSTYLNNNGDKPTLFKTDGSTVDTYIYTATQTDKSYSRIPDGGIWQVNIDPTKSSVKCIDLAPSPTPTPTPTPTVTPAPTTTSTPTPIATSTPTPTPTKTPTPIPTKTPTPSPTPSPTEDVSTSQEGIVLGIKEGDQSPTSQEASDSGEVKNNKLKTLIIPLILIFSGVVLIFTALFSLFKNRKVGYNEENGKE